MLGMFQGYKILQSILNNSLIKFNFLNYQKFGVFLVQQNKCCVQLKFDKFVFSFYSAIGNLFLDKGSLF